LIEVALWGIGIAGTIVIYQQAILLTGRKAPETATSIGVLLAQAGFAAGGATITILGVNTIPLIALAFVITSLIIATTLQPLIKARNQNGLAIDNQDRPATDY
jgi:predicted MFS family arabinose efflux permease